MTTYFKLFIISVKYTGDLTDYRGNRNPSDNKMEKF